MDKKRPITPVETARLILRPPSAADAPLLHAAICESFADLHTWMKWADKPPLPEETRARAIKAAGHFQTGEDFTLWGFLKETEEFVLVCTLHPLDWDVPKFEIGYWCHITFQGKGYVTEAVQALTRVGFEELGAQRLEIRCDPRNLRSSRVAIKAGYTLEAELKNEQRDPRGELRNTSIYARFQL